MLKVRVVKTGSSASAVQAVRYDHNKRTILKHFGSCHTQSELDELLHIAEEWIKDRSAQLSIFPDDSPNATLSIHHCSFLGVYHSFFYEVISSLQRQIGFTELGGSLLNDLVMMRILEPASKLRSIELLESYFGVRHLRKNFYKVAPQWLRLKDETEAKAVAFAQQHYGFDYDLIFYDVTTFYFETFEEDELRKQGFSKDNKSQQPQIVVALMVTKEGFPIGYEIFSGNTFEGHTIIPVITSFIKKHQVKNFIVIADAAMISEANVKELRKNKIHYIVGARMGNLPAELINTVDKSICREDGKTIRMETEQGFLVCSYSSVRYHKDKYEMEKQIEKAKQIIEKPAKNKKVKFTKTSHEKIELNEKLIEKTKKLLGIKGYYTDLEEAVASNQTIIDRYHELYKIEQAFRISKSDLQTRPIFHFKEEPIQLHLLICFMALALSKHIELKTGTSIRRFITDCKKITDARLLNTITGKEIRIRVPLNPTTSAYIIKLIPPH